MLDSIKYGVSFMVAVSAPLLVGWVCSTVLGMPDVLSAVIALLFMGVTIGVFIKVNETI